MIYSKCLSTRPMNFIKYLGLGDVAMHIWHTLVTIEIREFLEHIVYAYDSIIQTYSVVPPIPRPVNFIVQTFNCNKTYRLIGVMYGVDRIRFAEWWHARLMLRWLAFTTYSWADYMYISFENDIMHIPNCWEKVEDDKN